MTNENEGDKTEHIPLRIFVGIGLGILDKSVLREFHKHTDKCPECQKRIKNYIEEFKKEGRI